MKLKKRDIKPSWLLQHAVDNNLALDNKDPEKQYGLCFAVLAVSLAMEQENPEVRPQVKKAANFLYSHISRPLGGHKTADAWLLAHGARRPVPRTREHPAVLDEPARLEEPHHPLIQKGTGQNTPPPHQGDRINIAPRNTMDNQSSTEGLRIMKERFWVILTNHGYTEHPVCVLVDEGLTLPVAGPFYRRPA